MTLEKKLNRNVRLSNKRKYAIRVKSMQAKLS